MVIRGRDLSVHNPREPRFDAEQVWRDPLSQRAQSILLLVNLFISETIMSITSAALSDLLTACDCRMPKNSSKHAKIRKLMTLADVKEALGDDGVARMEAKLQEIEKNRVSKKRERAGNRRCCNA